MTELFNYSRNHRYVRAVVDSSFCFFFYLQFIFFIYFIWKIVGDQVLIKYWATIAGYFVMWIPILLNSNPEKTTGELTRDYARVSRYLQNVSGAVGELGLCTTFYKIFFYNIFGNIFSIWKNPKKIFFFFSP